MAFCRTRITALRSPMITTRDSARGTHLMLACFYRGAQREMTRFRVRFAIILACALGNIQGGQTAEDVDFSSFLRAHVWQLTRDDSGRTCISGIGETPRDNPIRIRGGAEWGLMPRAPVDLNALITELNSRSVPGLRVPGSLDCEEVAALIHGLVQSESALAVLELPSATEQLLALLPSLRGLRILAVSGVDDMQLKQIAGVSGLRKLVLEGNVAFTDVGLAELARLSNLVSLEFSGGRVITDLGMEYIARLPALREVWICSASRITDAGLKRLSRNSVLERITLSDAKITGVGFRAFRRMDSLRSVDVSWCSGLNSEGMQALANLTELRELRLAHCKTLDDAALQHIATLF